MTLVRIDKLFNFEKGILQSSKCVPGKYDFITASAEWKTHKEYSYDCEALIFAAAASGSLGRTHYVNGKFISSDLCFIITPKDPKSYPVDLKFYHIIFNEFKNDIVKNTKAGTSKEAIGLGSFGKYELPYFDINKQVEVKDRFYNAERTKLTISTELNCQLDLFEKLRQTFFREAMQGKLVPQDKNDEPASETLKKIKVEKEQLIKEKKIKKERELPPIKPEEIPFEIPENWVWCRLAEVAELITSGSRGWKQYYSKGGDLFIRSQNIRPSSLDLSNRAYVKLPDKSEGQRTRVFKNDILITITGAGVSNSALVENVDWSTAAYVSQHVSLIRLITGNMSKWVHMAIVSESIGKKQFSKLVYGDKPGLNLVQISRLVIPLPPLSEQHRIAAKLERLMDYCDRLELCIKECQTQNEQLLQQVLREALKPEDKKGQIAQLSIANERTMVLMDERNK